jgi:hypothetical protein
VLERSCGGGRLVIDRLAGSYRDARLLARLAPEEPAANAALVCGDYLVHRGGCRVLTANDLREAPASDPSALEADRDATRCDVALRDRGGARYALERTPTDMSIPELRWCARNPGSVTATPVSVREVIARVESYEPARAITHWALARHGDDERLSIATLRAELVRVARSPIVLNRGLREAVLAATARGEATMSEIATRCGRVKRDAKGNASGETTWLARRVGIAPEGGRQAPTPWVHTDVLALIARRGLGLSPHEVELG